MTPDIATLKLAQQGDPAAFAEVVAACYDTIFRFALKYTGQRQDAEDITQQACIKLARTIATYRFDAAFSSWLYPLVINCARDWYRQQSRHTTDGRLPDMDLLAMGSTAHSNEGESLIYLHQVLVQIGQMGEGFREAVVLVIGEGLSHAEAANALGVGESTVSWRIHEVRKRLNASASEETLI